MENILCAQKKIFNGKEYYNKQNDIVYVRSSEEVFEWFLEFKRVIIPLQLWFDMVLSFKNKKWSFQKDYYGPGHKTKITQNWLQGSCIKLEDWQSGNLDLNPLDL